MTVEHTTSERKRAVCLVQDLPWPLNGGWRIRSHQILSLCASKFDTTLVVFTDSTAADSDLLPLYASAPGLVEVIQVKHPLRIRKNRIKLASVLLDAFIRRQPYSIWKFRNRNMDRCIASLAMRSHFDRVFTTLPMLPYALRLVSYERIVYDSQNIESDLWSEYACHAPHWARPFIWRESRHLRRLEEELWRKCGAILAICREDLQVIKGVREISRTEILPPTIKRDIQHYQEWRGGAIGMIGNWNWAPSRISLDWFLKEIAPRLRQSRPDMSITIAGEGLDRQQILQMEKLNINPIGFVQEPQDFYSEIDIVVGPYIAGGGVRIKILEALLQRKLVIGTPLAFRGLPVQHSVSGIVSDSSQSMVEAILRYSSSREQSREVSARGYEDARALHCDSVAKLAFCNALGE